MNNAEKQRAYRLRKALTSLEKGDTSIILYQDKDKVPFNSLKQTLTEIMINKARDIQFCPTCGKNIIARTVIEMSLYQMNDPSIYYYNKCEREHIWAERFNWKTKEFESSDPIKQPSYVEERHWQYFHAAIQKDIQDIAKLWF